MKFFSIEVIENLVNNSEEISYAYKLFHEKNKGIFHMKSRKMEWEVQKKSKIKAFYYFYLSIASIPLHPKQPSTILSKLDGILRNCNYLQL